MADGSVRTKDPNDIELPLGKRSKKYRFLEILPGVLSYGMIALLFILSLISPTLGSIYILIIITITLVKAVGVAVRTLQGYKVVKRAMKVDWHNRFSQLSNPHENFEKLREEDSSAFGFDEHVENLRAMVAMPKEFPDPKRIYHAVIMVAYNEGMETLVPTVEAVRDNTFDSKRVIFVFGYEERGGEIMEKQAEELRRRFKDDFYDFIPVKHPDGLPGEIKGKGPNLCYAGEALTEYLRKRRISTENVIVTSLDSDNRMSEKYLDYVAYEYVVHEERRRMAFQPVSLFMNNIWDAPAPMRIIAVSNSFFNVINTMRPHVLRNFASHSQPLDALIEMDYWSKRTIVEDGHQFWRSLFFFRGKYDVLSIKVPIYQDAVIGDNFFDTLKAQFIQLRRWDYGASDVAYVGVRLFDKKRRKMPFLPLFFKFMRLLDGHVTLAAMSPMVAFGGWVPLLLNFQSRDVVTYNLPGTVSIIQTFAAIGLFITILLSLKMLPKRPAKYRKGKTVFMVLQWILMPIVAILYQSAAAFYAQTRLMLGRYMEKFDVTKKVVKAP
ncbi:glycosyltransferase family 2 protein [Candidatus Saccharibacteria bacterium]|nr:glycosyltransferase family 2 protein [Candidatus Saccharibacteria bacterium]